VFKRFQLWSKKTQKIFAQTLAGETNSQNLPPEKFKLLIINQFFPPDFAATGQLIQELSNQLDKQNIQVNFLQDSLGMPIAKNKPLQ
jgi:hypothetical protein